MVTRRSAKSKGRSFEKDILKDIQLSFGLSDSDISQVAASVNGVDIKLLSDKAYTKFPFSVECKRQEKLNIYDAVEQSIKNKLDNTYPLVVHKKNHKPTLVTLLWSDFLSILSNKKTEPTKDNQDLEKVLKVLNEIRQDIIRMMD